MKKNTLMTLAASRILAAALLSSSAISHAGKYIIALLRHRLSPKLSRRFNRRNFISLSFSNTVV